MCCRCNVNVIMFIKKNWNSEGVDIIKCNVLKKMVKSILLLCLFIVFLLLH